jgi:hypothetical protein
MNFIATIKLKEAQENREEYIGIMEGWDDKKLSKHIDLFREQRAMAYKKGDEGTMILLDEYEGQVIAARMRKNE